MRRREINLRRKIGNVFALMMHSWAVLNGYFQFLWWSAIWRNFELKNSIVTVRACSWEYKFSAKNCQCNFNTHYIPFTYKKSRISTIHLFINHMTDRNAPLCAHPTGTNCINIHPRCSVFIKSPATICLLRKNRAAEDKKGQAHCLWLQTDAYHFNRKPIEVKETVDVTWMLSGKKRKHIVESAEEEFAASVLS